jgi:hypothetical protein
VTVREPALNIASDTFVVLCRHANLTLRQISIKPEIDEEEALQEIEEPLVARMESRQVTQGVTAFVSHPIVLPGWKKRNERE